MIYKSESVPGSYFLRLLQFVHSEENQVAHPWDRVNPTRMVVQVKSVTPDQKDDGTWYGISLEIMELMPCRINSEKRDRIDPKYLLRVYEILGGVYK